MDNILEELKKDLKEIKDSQNLAELKAKYTKAAQLVELYEKYAAIDLTISYDYDGGYAQGFYLYTDKERLMPELLTDLYNYMVEKNAFVLQEQPTLETFLDLGWWNNYSKYDTTDLTAILFTPYCDSDGNIHEDYMAVNDEYGKFFNDSRYNKWVVIMDFVNEATQAGNMAGQDAWGRDGLLYAQYKYANQYMPSLANADLTKYSGSEVYVSNKGCVLGAYRFAQYVTGNIGSANHKSYIPDKYFSTVFDRQVTQERYGEQVYHCTDLTVTLYDAPYKEGCEFDGWYFVDENGNFTEKAVVTGSLFKDVTVKAKWLSKLQEKLEEQLNQTLTPHYYPLTTDGGKYTKEFKDGTLSTQEEQVGIGEYAIVVNDDLYVMPKSALIRLGLNATADYTISEKNDETCPYGIDTAQNSTGIVYNSSTGVATKQNSYGHGALYLNASNYKITFSDVSATTYGRQLAGADYGYERFVFVPQEDGTYLTKFVGSAANTELTLNPGEFLWCPMTAERWSVPLTNCNGVSGAVGVLSDGLTIKVVDISKIAPASKAWTATKFYDGDKLIGQFYLETGESFEVPTPATRIGYDFVGWATKADATAEDVVETIPTTPTESVTYYAVFVEVSRFNLLVVDPNYEGTDANVFTTFAEAFLHTNDNCTIQLVATTYTESIVINSPMTIAGPNADARGYWERGDEAVFTGTIDVNSNNVTLKGIHFGGDDSIYLADAYSTGTAPRKIQAMKGIEGFTFENNYVTAGRIFLSFGANTNTVIKNNFFNWTEETMANKYTYWRPIRMDGVSTDYQFVGNKVVSTYVDSSSSGFYDLLYFANVSGNLLIEGNDICINCFNWMFNVAAGTNATEIDIVNNVFSSGTAGSDENAGWACENLHEDCVCVVSGNTFEGVAGTTFSYKTVKHLEVTANEFLQSTFKPRINAEIGEGFVYSDNYVAAETVTAVSGYLTVSKDTATQAEAIEARRAKYGVRTIDEVFEVLFTDYAAWAGADDVATFKADYIAKTGTYDSNKEFYSASKQGVIDDTLGTFAHSTAYGAKYLPVVDALDAYVKDVNSTQAAWSSTWTGLLRFREYLQRNEARVSDKRDQMFIDGMTEGYRQLALSKLAAQALTGTKLGEFNIEAKNVSMWNPTYYNNYVYLDTGAVSGTYWSGIYLNKVYGNVYEVLAYKATGARPVDACDFSIIIFSGNETDYNYVDGLALQAGDFVSFDTDPASIEDGELSGTLPVATVYRLA